MKSFGIGLALLVGGFASYFLTNALKKTTAVIEKIGEFLQTLAQAGFLPEGVTLPEEFGPETVSKIVGIPLSLINVAPYICLGIMAFGVAWFWLIEPLLYLATPPKPKGKEETAVTPSISVPRGVEEAVPSGKDLKQLISEAIEQWVRDAIREKIEREKGK